MTMQAGGGRLLKAGRYVLVKPLVTGGFSRVFLALTPDGQRVVIKSQSGAEGALLEREATLLRKLAGAKRFVRLVDSFSEQDETFLVEEYIENAVRLDEWQKTRSRREILMMYAEIAKSLAELASQNIVHRDLKPENVLIRDGRPVLIDFGFAVSLAEHDELTSPLNTVIGTPEYMSPETFTGAKLESTADLYSLGLMLIHALSGRSNLTVDSLTIALQRRVTGNPNEEAVGELRGKVPNDVLDLLRRLGDPRPFERPAVEEVVDVLERAGETFHPSAFRDYLKRYWVSTVFIFGLLFLAVATVTKQRLTGTIGLVALVVGGVRDATGKKDKFDRHASSQHIDKVTAERIAAIEARVRETAALTDSIAASVAGMNPEQLVEAIATSVILKLSQAPHVSTSPVALQAQAVLASGRRLVTSPDLAKYMSALRRDYTGVWGAKVFWLALLTLCPVFLAIKIHEVKLNASIATCVFLTYHSIGIFIWANVRHGFALPDDHDSKHWKRMYRLRSIHHPLGWVVSALIMVTIAAVMNINFRGSHHLHLPLIAYDILGIEGPPSG